MTNDFIKQLTQQCSLFHDLEESELLCYLEHSYMEEISLNKGSYVFSENDVPRGIYILLSGAISIGRMSVNGQRLTISEFNEFGTVFGEVFYYLDLETYAQYAYAEENSHVLLVKEVSNIMEPCYQKVDVVLKRNMLHILAQKSYYLNQKLRIISRTTLREKICCLLYELPKAKYMTREEMAEYLSVSRPSVSRELLRMQEEHIIRLEKGKIQIVDMRIIESYV